MLKGIRAALLAAVFAASHAVVAQGAERWQTCFTPGEDCTDAIVEEIGRARDSIRVQAYAFTSVPIAEALATAKRRGVDVEVIIDRSNRKEPHSVVPMLLEAGIPVWIDDKVAIAHNKVIVIDRETVVTGSFNFTKSAQARNAENVMIIERMDVARDNIRNWTQRRATARPWRGE